MRVRLLVLVSVVVGGFVLLAQSRPYDVVLTHVGEGGGRVFTGLAGVAGRLGPSIGIRDGRIATIGDISAAELARAGAVLDATGLTVAPGFIDVHSHGLETLARPAIRDAAAELAQGVTTIVGNPDGGGPVDLAKQRATLEADGGIGVNVALLIGHGSVRSAVMGAANRAPTADELARMTAIVTQGVADGAFGLSSGLFYSPGRFAKTEEVIALAKAAGGVYTSHIRDEGNYDAGLIPSVDEVIRVADEARVTGIVSHVKALGPDSWGKSAEIIAHVDAARRRGVTVWADQYPYEASSTSLSAAVLPGVATAAVRERLGDPATKAGLLAEAAENIRRRGGAHAIAIASTRESALNGQRLDGIAKAKGVSEAQAAIDIILNGGASIVSFNMSEADIRALMRQSWTMTSSDGGLSLPGEGVPHPRNNGAFARKLAHYVRDQKVVTLEAALHSMTALPALVFGMADRGVIRGGAFADLVVFDPARIQDRATYENPHQLATGMTHVIVNGRVAWRDGKGTGVRAGVVLRRPRT